MSSAPEKFAHPILQDSTNQKQPPARRPADDVPVGPSAIEKFLESFMQERNIKWMLGIGVLILLGSSLSFVRSHWDNMQQTFRYLVVLGYTGIIHLCGQAAYHKMNLRKTGTALMAVTLLLIPLVFFSLHWVAGGTVGHVAGFALVLCAASVFSTLAARRIFRHFLRGDQPAVLISFLSLSLLGAVAPILPAAMGPLWAFLAWALFAFGSVKANREVFWMTEEHKLPRIFGFFPIALFGLQFLGIFGWYFADSFPTNDWYGLGCVLTAIPIMLTADAFANVFKQRTGDLVRPLPWSISGPIVVGIILGITGLCIAATGIAPPGKPFALVPTAAVFAIMMGVSAKRTGKRGFTWAMLVGATLAYQFAPVFFLEVVRNVRNAAASALNKSPGKLEFAYYGLTYMPFLMVCSLASVWRKRLVGMVERDVFITPLRRFTLGASVLLLFGSFPIPGANFMVAAAMVPFLLWQAFVYGRREAAGFGLIAFVTAGVRLVPFLEQVYPSVNLPADASILALGLTALFLQVIGPKLDALLDSRTTSGAELPRLFTHWQTAALPITLGAVGWWLVSVLPVYTTASLWSGLLLAKLLFAQAILSPKRSYGELALSFGMLLAGVHSLSAGWLSLHGLIPAGSAVLFAMWIFGRVTRKRTDRFAMAFSVAAHRLSHLLILVAFAAAFSSITSALGFRSFVPELAVGGLIGVVWCFAEGRSQSKAILPGFVLLLANECGLVSEMASAGWIAVAWAATSLGALRFSRMQENATLEIAALTVLSMLSFGPFVVFSMPMAIAGGLAAVGFLMQSAVSQNRSLRCFSFIAINWQIIGLVFRFVCPEITTVFELNMRDVVDAALPMAAVTAFSSLLFHHPGLLRMKGRDSEIRIADLIDMQFWALSVVSGAFLVLSVMHLSVGLLPLDILCAMVAFGCLAASTFLSACKTKSEGRVWGAQAILLAAVLYLAMFKVLTFGHGISMFAVLGVAVLNSTLARFAASRESMSFAVRPLRQLARAFAMGTVCFALIRYGKSPADGWLGLNSLAVLVSAAYYFWCGIEEKRKGLIVLAASIVNFALILLWKDLKFTDPQFFMIPIGVSVIGLVELLKREVPASMRNPLRYAGALMILVSPTFHIVDGSWLHLISLLVCSVLVALVAIGLRIRPLLYAGTAFLVADVIAMVVRSSLDHTELLWLYGLGAGAAVIALAAFFENHRANVLARMRTLSAELHTWD